MPAFPAFHCGAVAASQAEPQRSRRAPVIRSHYRVALPSRSAWLTNVEVPVGAALGVGERGPVVMPGHSLSLLSDQELLRALAVLVARDRTTTAALLAHLAE